MSYRHDKLNLHEVLVKRVFKMNADAETLGGNRTLVDEEGPILAFDCGGSGRNLTLPARAAANDGVVLFVNNISTAGESITIKNSAATTLLTLPSQGVALVFASVLDETPGTRAWRAVPIGGEDLALADDLTVAGDLTVTGNTTHTGTLVQTGAATVTGTLTATSGARLGDAAADLIGFYTGTGITQRAGSNQASTNLASSTDFAATQTAIVQEIMATLTALGLWKGAA